jgi:hypothetical protein
VFVVSTSTFRAATWYRSFSPDQQLYAEWIVLPDAITELFDQHFSSDRFLAPSRVLIRCEEI